MSRTGSGTYTTPNTMVAGEVITASDHNENYADIGAEITNSVAVDGQSTMTGSLKAANGTLAVPSYTFGSDTDTGFYRVGANSIGVAIGAVSVALWDSGGFGIVGAVNATTVKQGGFQLIPPGIMLDYAGSTAPDGWLLCYGQNVSRTTYSALFAIIGTTYGAGDGSTTFTMPDCRGRVRAGKDNMGGSAAGLLTATYFGAADGALGTTLGAKGGSQAHTLAASQIPSITSANASQTINTTTQTIVFKSAGVVVTIGNPGGSDADGVQPGTGSLGSVTTTGVNSITATSNNTGGLPHNNVQPTIIVNTIIYAGV
jgi:microcystin-dependent protein